MGKTDKIRALTAAKKEKFLEAYAKVGVIGAACKSADICRRTYYEWRDADKAFAQLADDAFQEAVDEAELELRRRGVDGVEEPVLHKGVPVWRRDPATGELLLDDDFEPIPFTTTRHSDRLLEVYTRSHRPIYKERSEVALTGVDGGPVDHEITVRFVKPEDVKKEEE